jgi:hypothetical protein
MTASIQARRNVEGMALFALLEEQQARKIDLIVPAAKLRFEEGRLILKGLEPLLEEDGITDPNGSYELTDRFDDHLGERLYIKGRYLSQLRHGRTNERGRVVSPPRLDLFDANVNGLLQGRKGKVTAINRDAEMNLELGVREMDDQGRVVGLDGLTYQWDDALQKFFRYVREPVAADSRSFLVRLFRGDTTGEGIARALLSDRFARMDNFDGFLAMMQGIQEAGIDPSTLKISGDLTESRMYIHVAAPEIAALAPELLNGYRSPFDQAGEQVKRQTHGMSIEDRIAAGQAFRERNPQWNGTSGTGDGHNIYKAGEEPIVHAGFTLTNSEVGQGRWVVTPGITVLRCSNGLTMVKEAFGRTHVGGKQDEGVMAWSEDTQSKELALVRAQTRDIVARSLTREYVEATVATLTEKATKPIADAEKAIEVLAKKLSFSEEEKNGILRHFFMGGQSTSGGVMQAITSYSQTVESADAAHDLNSKAVEAMELAYAIR